MTVVYNPFRSSIHARAQDKENTLAHAYDNRTGNIRPIGVRATVLIGDCQPSLVVSPNQSLPRVPSRDYKLAHIHLLCDVRARNLIQPSFPLNFMYHGRDARPLRILHNSSRAVIIIYNVGFTHTCGNFIRSRFLIATCTKIALLLLLFSV